MIQLKTPDDFKYPEDYRSYYYSLPVQVRDALDLEPPDKPQQQIVTIPFKA